MRRLVFILTVLAGAAAVAAPPGQWQCGTPVDQAVGDLDGLTTSLRNVQVGLRSTGEQTSLYQQVVAAGEPDYDRAAWVSTAIGQQRAVYYRIGPGFRARVSRLNYLVRVGDKGLALNIAPRFDGEFVELIPNDTVFELNPSMVDYRRLRSADSSAVRAAIPAMTPVAGLVNGRVDGQINGRIDGRVGK